MAMTNAERYRAAVNDNDYTGAVQAALNRHGYYVLGRAGAADGYVPTAAHLQLARVAVESPHLLIFPIAMRLLTHPESDGFASIAEASDGWLADTVPGVFETYASVLFGGAEA